MIVSTPQGATIPWEAAATLASGLLAVGAATIVALRQIGIARRQLEIQQALALIEAAKLRADLFDRRFAIYEATARFAAAIFRTATFPPSDVERDFALARDRAQMLFGPEVQAALGEGWDKACDLLAAEGKLEGEHDPNERARWAAQKSRSLVFFAKWLGAFNDVFGDELRLIVPSIPDAPRRSKT